MTHVARQKVVSLADCGRATGEERLPMGTESEMAASGDLVLVSEVCRVFAGLLALDEVSPDDDFFQCGGHSLLGTRLISRLNVELGLHLTLRQLLEHPTARSIVAVTRLCTGDVEASSRPSLRRRSLN